MDTSRVMQEHDEYQSSVVESFRKHGIDTPENNHLYHDDDGTRVALAQCNDTTAVFERTRPDFLGSYNGSVIYFDTKIAKRDFFVEAFPFYVAVNRYAKWGVQTVYLVKWPHVELAILATDGLAALANKIYFFRNSRTDSVHNHVRHDAKIFSPTAEIREHHKSRGSGDAAVCIPVDAILACRFSCEWRADPTQIWNLATSIVNN